ncbi:hypothetical protein QBC35DRAFT_67282 [Podospora australis]|uniref:Uncharacterized protein n=1 Tax=Podospora australis TaxID=1536484 RepID=A0AAN7AED4_9PEZI|nr:hypothetical protein QBC35DRAFT_67282 [Podospora australis]
MSQTSSFPLSTGDGADSTLLIIYVTSVSAFGDFCVPATRLQRTLNPWGHDPGGIHTISLSLIGLLVGTCQQILEALSRQEECFVKVDWRFHLPYPKFTTRHRVVPEDTPQISFSGGLDWALKIFQSMESTNMAAPPIRSMSLPMSPQFNTRERQKEPFSSNRAATWNHPSSSHWLPAGSGNFPSFSAPLPFPGSSNILFPPPGPRTDSFPILGPSDTPRSMTPALSDDGQSSVSSGLTSPGGIISDAASGSSYFSSLSTRQNSSRVDELSNQGMDKLAEHQLLDEQFQQQKREAEALYARTGDVSGLRAVLALASKS